MYKNIVFYNHFHNGDIHLSREFVRKLSEVFRQKLPGVNISYSHKNNASLLADIPNLGYNQVPLNWHEHEGVMIRGDTILINTWYAQRRFLYMNRYGITFDCLYLIFDDVCKTHFGFSLSEIESDPTKWFPAIDFSKFEIANAKQRLDACQEPMVLVSNGHALSGQAENFPMLPAICNLANKYQGIVFILTNHEPNFNPSQHSNIFYSSDIIKKNGFDLNENAFVSTYCDVIIGRASGAYSFSFIQQNLFQKPKTFICFSNLVPSKENTFWLSEVFRDKVQYTSKIVVVNESRTDAAEKLIERNLHV
jgi:hypothetical protein